MWYPGGSNDVVILCNPSSTRIVSCRYQGEALNKGASAETVECHLNGLFSLVQGLGGTAVVRTYIDQLAQVLSALIGWSRIEKCGNGGWGGNCKNSSNKEHHGQHNECGYLKDVQRNDPCDKCECIKWKKSDPNNGVQLGRGCKRCSDSGVQQCQCTGSGGGDCKGPGEECKCAKEGKCCKCCCTSCNGCKRHAKCSCDMVDYGQGYTSAYGPTAINHGLWNVIFKLDNPPTWKKLGTSRDRAQCARILLGSVCLIWSGVTYMYWTGKWAKTSPYWNNHILDGSGLDDGTLSQWLQALGFPRDMINNHGPGNRMDAVIWDGFRDKFFLGFLEPSGLNNHHVNDTNGNTARAPFGMNYAGFVHTIHRDSFNEDATVFKKDSGSSITETSQHKNGAIFKLYIVSCAYFTGLQKKPSESTPSATNNPKTIREVLYWLSALPYSPAYKGLLRHCNGALEKASPTEKKLSFHQTGRTAPITVHEFNLFAHFQAVTQYCPLVLIGIQGGIHSTTKGTDSTKEPPIHSLYANTACAFTYPTVDIQAYNQVVHYIRGLFYQLYFLRKQCAVKVTCGGKWRECRYGSGVLGKGVISWMCLGCNPMEHDRKSRVTEMGKGLVGVKTGDAVKVKELLIKIGGVVVQLGNAQEALERKKKEAIEGVIKTLGKAKEALEGAKGALEEVNGGLTGKLGKAKTALGELTNGGSGALHTLTNGSGNGSLQQITSENEEWQKDYSSAKDKISDAINKVRDVLRVLEKEVPGINGKLNGHQDTLLTAIKKIVDVIGDPNCPSCKDHKDKCGRQGEKKTCDKCHQQYMDGTPSPLQAFLEDRLPGFSCDVVRSDDTDQPYPPAASHLGHCGGSGQCCPLPMGFRNSFCKGSTSDMTGSRLYGILYFFSNENMMQSCVYTLVRVTAELSATTPQVLGDVFGFFRGGVGNPEEDKEKKGNNKCDHIKDPKDSNNKDEHFCGWCASGLRDEVKKIEWIQKVMGGEDYRKSVGAALIAIKGDKGTGVNTGYSSAGASPSALSTLTKDSEYLSPLTGELYTAVSATFGGTYLSWVLYLSDALEGGLKSLASAFQEIECRGCRECDPNKCKKGHHGEKSTGNSGRCQCQSIVSCTGVLPVLYRHGFSYGNPFNLEGYQQKDEKNGDYSIDNKGGKKQCHEFLDAINAVIDKNNQKAASQDNEHPLTNLLSQVGQLQYDIRLPWIFVLTVAWLVAVLYLAFGAIWPLDWTHMRSHWLRGGEHQWQCMWYKVMTGRKGVELIEYFGRQRV